MRESNGGREQMTAFIALHGTVCTAGMEERQTRVVE